jgi:tetratricopeptide (TPR) repeat protein
MASGIPIVRQLSWLTVLPQVVALFGAMAVAFLLNASNPALYGAAAYLAYSIGSRIVITRSHRAGVRLTKQQRFAEAIPKFQQSLAFFESQPWIDRFRSIVLMSPSAASYREMALANIAFCYGQLGDGEQSRAYYRDCLDRFPESGLATAALRMLDSVSTPAATSRPNS